MNKNTTLYAILNVLNDMGLTIEYSDKDIDLREYIVDSLEFVSFIMEIEQSFDIEIPSNLLLYDNISSIVGFSAIIDELKQDI